MDPKPDQNRRQMANKSITKAKKPKIIFSTFSSNKFLVDN